MEKSYTLNYIKIYLWQIISIILGFSVMFVVVPFISKDSTIYGIYSVCTSLSIFMSYADLGFIGAGQKYAAEYYAKGDEFNEIRTIGFSCFWLLMLVLGLSMVFLYFSYNPTFIIGDISKGTPEYLVACKLFLILSISAPLIVLTRMLQMIFGIRLQDYKFQRVVIGGNSLKLLLVFYFFREAKYDIVGYFLSIQIITFLVCILGMMVAFNSYRYNFELLFRSFRFSITSFNKLKALALASILITVSWILYYELDSMFISKFIGASQVAMYAIGFTILTFFRSIFGILFSPFSARFNHFIALGQEEQLKRFYSFVLKITFPLTVFPILVIFLLLKPFILAWVGYEYLSSVSVAGWLILCNILAFVSYPAGNLLMAKERVKEMNLVAIIAPIVYWIGIVVSVKQFSILSFGIFKFIVFLLMGIFYILVTMRMLNINFLVFTKKFIVPYLLPILFIILVLSLTSSFFIGDRSIYALIKLMAFAFFIIVTALAISLFFAPELLNYLKKILSQAVRNRNENV